MTVFTSDDAIKAFLEEFDSWLSESVTLYLLGGSAMAVQGLKDPREALNIEDLCGRVISSKYLQRM